MFEILETPIAGLQTVVGKVLGDARGTFARLFCEDSLSALLGGRHIVQINRSVTHKIGAVRGMHFQRPPHTEMKLVRCLRGRVFDVAIDLRRDSPTFLSWHGVQLSGDTSLMFVIPEGFAHGFQVLEQDSELLYLHTAAYAPSAEDAIAYNDPRVAITWPNTVTEISARDQNHPNLTNFFQGLIV